MFDHFTQLLRTAKIPGQDRMMIGQTQHKALLLRYAIFISFVQLLCQSEQYDRPLTWEWHLRKLHLVHSKGQLISKRLFGIPIYSEKRTKKYNLTTMISQVDLFSFLFWKNLKTPKRHFEINWPLNHTHNLN